MEIIIICLTVLLLALVGVGIYQDRLQIAELFKIEKEMREYEKEEKERDEKRRQELQKKQEYNEFTPYLICTINDEEIYNEKDEIVGTLPMKTFHTIIFEENGKGQLFSGEGWVKLDNVIKNPVCDLQAPMTIVVRSPLKNGPGLGYKTLGEVMPNEKVEVMEIFGVWCKIKIQGGTIGYVYYKNLR